MVLLSALLRPSERGAGGGVVRPAFIPTAVASHPTLRRLRATLRALSFKHVATPLTALVGSLVVLVCMKHRDPARAVDTCLACTMTWTHGVPTSLLA